MEKKTCYGPRCNGKEKLVEEFNKNKSRHDGLQSWCKECQSYQSKTTAVTNINPVSSQVKMMEDELRKKESEIKALRKMIDTNTEPDCTSCRYYELGKTIEKLQLNGDKMQNGKKYVVEKDGTVQFMS